MTRIFHLVLIFLFSISFPAIAKGKIDKQNWPEKIIFLREHNVPNNKSSYGKKIGKPAALSEYFNSPHKPGEKNKTSSIKVEMDTKKMVGFIKKYKNALCSSNPCGSFEIWFTVTAEGNIGIASLRGESGLKAIINCPKDDK